MRRRQITFRTSNRLLLILLAFWTMGACLGAQEMLTEEQVEWLADHPGLRMGFTGIPPQVFQNHRTGELSGFCIDYLAAIEKSIGYRFERRYYPTWLSMMTALDANEIDVVYAAQQTPRRLEKYIFSQPYLIFQNMILVNHRTQETMTLSSLKGQHVAVVRGSALEEEISTRFPDINLSPVEDEMSGILKLSFDEVEAMVVEPSRATWVVEEKKITNVRVAGMTDIIFRLGYMMRKDKETLCEILNLGIKRIPDTDYHRMLARWIHPPEVDSWSSMLWLIGIPSGAIVVVVLWNVLLRRRVAARTGELNAELKRREEVERLRGVAEEQFRHTIEYCPLGIHMWQLEPDGRLVLTGANTAAERILRMDHQPLIRQDICEAFPGTRRTEIPRIYREVCTNGIPFSDTQHTYQDDRIVGIYEIFAFQTAPGQMAVMFTEISDRIAAQEALRQSEAQLSSIFRASPAAIGVVINRVMHQVNDQMCHMLGYSRDELLGKSTRMIYETQEEFDKVGSEKYAEIQISGIGMTQTRWRHKNGTVLDILLSAAAIDPADLSKGSIFVALDISDQVRTQRQLERNERRLSLAISATADAIWEWNLKTGETYYSPRWYEMLGYGDHQFEMTFGAWKEICHPDDYEPAMQQIQESLQKQQMYSVEFRMKNAEGSWVWILGRGKVVESDSDGKPVLLSGTNTDITERKRAASEREEALALLQAALAQSSAGILIADAPDVTIRWANAAAFGIRGETDKPLTGIDVSQHTANWQTFRPDRTPYPPEELPLSRAVLHGETTRDELVIIRDAEGEDRWVSVNAAPVRDLAGRITSGIVIFADITDRKRVEEALRESEERYRETFEFAVDGILRGGADGTIIGANSQMVKFTGRSLNELIGLHISTLFDQEELGLHPLQFDQVNEGKTVVNQRNLLRPDGTKLQVEMHSKKMPDGTYQSIYRDITERLKAEHELWEAKSILQAAMDNSPVGIVIADAPDGKVRYVNNAGINIHGGDRKSLIDNVAIDQYVANWQVLDFEGRPFDKYELPMTRAILYGETCSREFVIRRAEQDRIVIANAAPVKDEQGRVTAGVAVFMDITDRVRAEETLRLFQFAIEHSGESAFWMDSNAKFIYVNNAACERLGYTRQELLELSVKDVDPKFPADIWPIYWQDLREKKTLRFESFQKTKNGIVFAVEITANYVCFEGREYNCSFVREIGERKQFERAIDAFVQTVSSCVGQDMFNAFASELSALAGADIVVISRVSGEKADAGKLQTMAYYKDGQLLENFVYSYSGTPCEATLSYIDRLHIIPDHITDLYPGSMSLVEEHIVSYIGVPLRSVDGRPLGTICLLFRRALANTMIIERILKIFASQAVMEFQRMEGQQELAHSEYRFREMFERMSSAVAILKAVDDGEDFIFTDYNPAAERIDRISKGEVIGRRVTEIFPGVEAFGLLEVFSDVWKTGGSAHHPIGLYKDERFSGWRDNYVYKLPTGEIVSLYDDVSEQIRTQEMIRRNSERLQVLLDLNQMTDVPLKTISDFALEEAVRMTQSKIGYLAFVNEAETILTMYSWSKNAMATCDIADKPIEYHVDQAGFWAEAVRQRKPIICNDYALPNPMKKGLPDGHVKLVRHLHVPVFSGSKKVVMVAGVGNKGEDYDQSDVQQLTLLMDGLWHLIERIQAEQSRDRLLKEIQSKNDELESIVFVASHDLRSPLINIQGFAGELKKSCQNLTSLLTKETLGQEREIRWLLDQEIPESLGFISAGASKMDSLVKGLLQIARIGTVQLRIETIDVKRMLTSIINTVRYQMREHDIDIRVGDLPRCIADWQQLNQVFSNLIDNAIKYRHPDHKAVIEIAGEVHEGRVVYAIHDNGIGIEREHCDKIFEIFHRLNPAGPVKGEGLGLTIVRRTLDRMNGKIAVDSELNQGTTFRVDLPAAQ